MLLSKHSAIIKAMLLILLQTKNLESFSTKKSFSSSNSTKIKRSLKSSNLDSSSLFELIKESNLVDSKFIFKRIKKRDSLDNEINKDEDKEDKNFKKFNQTVNYVSNDDLTNFNDSNIEVPSLSRSTYYKYILFFARVLYFVICVVGLCGNSLVIYVVLRFSKMQTVTNLYILNLALADFLFLFGLPFLIITITYNYWAFGWLMCKIYMILTSINQFTSSLLLTVMSADRYIAVCHPISSPRYRTPCIAKIICLSVWTLSAYLMVPIFVFSDVQKTNNRISCNIYWPEIYDNFKGQRAFTIYSFTLGFFVPLILILLFYFMIICKLRTISTKHKSKEKKKTQKKVTYLVLIVISVYICCWLPYWITQVYITFEPPMTSHNDFSFTVMLLAGCLSYANSATNPFLYGFLSENFKKSFAKAFTCAANIEVNAQLHGENSVFPQQQQHHLSKNKHSSSSKAETASTYLASDQNKVKKKSKSKSSKTKLKESKKQSQITNLTSKINLRKNKRLSLDLSGQPLDHRDVEQLNQETNNLTNYQVNDSQQNSDRSTNNRLKLIKLTPNNKEVQLSFELNEHRLNETDPINKTFNSNQPMSSTQFKRRRRSEPRMASSNGFGQTKNYRRKSTLISQEEENNLNSDDEDDVVYESEDEEDEDFEDDSSLNSQNKERNCVAIPSRFKEKFLSVSTGSKFRLHTLNRKSNSIERTTSSASLEVINNKSTKIRKISLASKDSGMSEQQQIKKSNKNRLFSLMNKLMMNKQTDRTKEEQMFENNRIPEKRISRKRITRAEAEHHRFGNLRHIKINETNTQFSNQFNCQTIGCRNESKQGETYCRTCLDQENNCFKSESNLNNLHHIENTFNKNLNQSNSESSNKANNDKNNNCDDQFTESNSVNNCTNKLDESFECAQCTKCLENGVIQTQL